MAVKVKKQVSDIVKLATEIATNANKPMSIDQIKGKFQVEFPFNVKKVILHPSAANHITLPVGLVIEVKGLKKAGEYVVETKNGLFWTPGEYEQWVLV